MRDADLLTDFIIGEAIAIHRELRSGLFESTYEIVLADALQRAGLAVERQKLVPIVYAGRTITEAYRLDLLVEQRVVVECKAMDRLAPIHSQQLLTHLRLGGYPVGLLLNFGAEVLRDGIKRVVNHLPPLDGSRVVVNRVAEDMLPTFIA